MFPSYNHNISYAQHNFHVQTEDSGMPNWTLITHVFCAGEIVATLRERYAPETRDHDPKAHVGAMQAQHQAAMRALIRGQYDAVLTAHGITLHKSSP